MSKREGKRRFKRRRKDNIKTHCKDIRFESVNWVCRDRWRAAVNRVMELGVPQSAEKFFG